jgi:hypothetical protein
MLSISSAWFSQGDIGKVFRTGFGIAAVPTNHMYCSCSRDMQEHDHPISSLSIDSWLSHCSAGFAAICPRPPANGIIRLFPSAPPLSLKTGERPGFVWHCHSSIQGICSREPPPQESGDVLPLTRLAFCKSFDPAVIVRYFHSHLSAGLTIWSLTR